MKKNTTSFGELTFEKMQLSDLPQVMTIENEAFSNPWSANIFELGLRSPRSNEHFYVTRQHAEIVGYIVFQLLVPEGHIFSIAVAARYQRRGIAKHLLASALKFMATHGAREVFLEVAVTNLPAQALYRQFEFRIRGTRKNYYGHCKDAYILACCLQAHLEN